MEPATASVSGADAVMHGLHAYVDIDDVLAETTRALAELARARFGRDVEFESMHSFDLSVSLGLSPDEYTRFMEAAHEAEFLGALAPVPGAATVLREWHCAGAEISIVTGRPPACHAITDRWLRDAGFDHHRLEMVDKYGRHTGPAVTPRSALASRNYDVAIEDSAEMADFLAASTGARVLLVDRPWNRSARSTAPGVHRVSTWAEIREAVAVIARR